MCSLLYSPMPEIPPVRAHLPEEPRILKTHKAKGRVRMCYAFTKSMQPFGDKYNDGLTALTAHESPKDISEITS